MNKLYCAALSVIASLSICSCGGNKVSTKGVTDVSQTMAVLHGSGKIPADMRGVSFGFILSLDEDPSLDMGNAITVKAKEFDGKNSFFVVLSDLEPATLYYYKSFMDADGYMRTGNVKSFTTKDFDVKVTTEEVSDIGCMSATLKCDYAIYSDDQLNAKKYFCLSSETNNPDSLQLPKYRYSYPGPVNRYDFAGGVERGSFSEVFDDLQPATTYYYMPVMNVAGNLTPALMEDGRYYYGAVKSFTTKSFLMGAVDLGLSVKWASCNLGEDGFVDSVEEQGVGYVWGKIDPNEEIPYHFRYIYDQHDFENMTPEKDAAHVKLGGNWRIPTSDEFDELINSCQSNKATLKEVQGRVFTGKNGNAIFIPNGGYGNRDSFDENGHTTCLSISGTSMSHYQGYVYYHYFIRPVWEE